jgi:ferric-dicitrate binding protein FerR (iron transport regulator)
MKHNYNKELFDQLIRDDAFIGDHIKSDNTLAEEWRIKYPGEENTVQIAREFVQAIYRAEHESISFKSSKKDAIWKKIEVDTQSKLIQMNQSDRKPWRWMAFAASIALLISFGLIFTMNFSKKEITVARAERENVKLPDGSRIFFNAESEASWKKGGKFLKNRQIELSGEAFFEVEEGNQFLVNTDLGQVEVLGTSFNVLSRENIFSVQCATGRVRVRLKNGQSQILSPGEGVFMNSTGSLVFEEINEQTKIGSWRQNKHLYSNISYKDLIAELERQFGIEIFVDHELENRYGNFYFSSANIDSALYQITWPLDALYEQRSEDQYRIYLKK